jgi:hypothetical protein
MFPGAAIEPEPNIARPTTEVKVDKPQFLNMTLLLQKILPKNQQLAHGNSPVRGGGRCGRASAPTPPDVQQTPPFPRADLRAFNMIPRIPDPSSEKSASLGKNRA